MCFFPNDRVSSAIDAQQLGILMLETACSGQFFSPVLEWAFDQKSDNHTRFVASGRIYIYFLTLDRSQCIYYLFLLVLHSAFRCIIWKLIRSFNTWDALPSLSASLYSPDCVCVCARARARLWFLTKKDRKKASLSKTTAINWRLLADFPHCVLYYLVFVDSAASRFLTAWYMYVCNRRESDEHYRFLCSPFLFKLLRLWKIHKFPTEP